MSSGFLEVATADDFGECSQKANQADGHIDVHEEHAPALIGTDREPAANAQHKADPRGYQRRVVRVACAKKANQAQRNQ